MRARALCLMLSYQLQPAAPPLAELLRRVALSGYMRGLCVRGITRSSTGKTRPAAAARPGRLSYRRRLDGGKLTLRGKQPRRRVQP